LFLVRRTLIPKRSRVTESTHGKVQSSFKVQFLDLGVVDLKLVKAISLFSGSVCPRTLTDLMERSCKKASITLCRLDFKESNRDPSVAASLAIN